MTINITETSVSAYLLGTSYSLSIQDSFVNIYSIVLHSIFKNQLLKLI